MKVRFEFEYHNMFTGLAHYRKLNDSVTNPENPVSDYYPASDYEALEAKCDDWHKVADDRTAEIIRLKAKLARLVEEVDAVADSLFPGTMYAKLKAAIDAVKVKP